MSDTTPSGILNPPATDAVTRELREQFAKRKERAEAILLNTQFDTLHDYHDAYARAATTRMALEDFEAIVGKHERT